MSVDLLSGKYPMDAPYMFAGNNPIVMIDPDGKEKIIVVGAQPDTKPENKLMFMNQAIRQLRKYKSKEAKTVLLFTEGYTEKQIRVFKSRIEKYGGTLIEVGSSEEVVNYINSKKTETHGLTPERGKDPVTKVDAFAHGVVGEIAFGYHTTKEKEYSFGVDDAKQLDPAAFAKGAVFESFACRTGLGNNGSDLSAAFTPASENSLAQAISNTARIQTTAWLVRSDYTNTLGNKFDRNFGTKPLTLDIDGGKFLPQGAPRDVQAGSTPSGVQQSKQTFLPRPN